ncbi:MAG: 6-phosphogluconolactonase, partial [Candidatus Paceibacterota bacterium]
LSNTHVVGNAKEVTLFTTKGAEIGKAKVVIRNVNERPLIDDITILTIAWDDIHSAVLKGVLEADGKERKLIPIGLYPFKNKETAALVSGFRDTVSSGFLVRLADIVLLLGATAQEGDSGSPYLVQHQGVVYSIAINTRKKAIGMLLSPLVKLKMLKALEEKSKTFIQVNKDTNASEAVKKFLSGSKNVSSATVGPVRETVKILKTRKQVLSLGSSSASIVAAQDRNAAKKEIPGIDLNFLFLAAETKTNKGYDILSLQTLFPPYLATLPLLYNGNPIGYIPVFLSSKGSLHSAVNAPPAVTLDKVTIVKEAKEHRRIIVPAEDFSKAASNEVASEIKRLQEDQQRKVVVVFATGNTMVGFLNNLAKEEGIDWSRVIAFHLDEYKGLPTTHPASFAYFLNKNLFSRVSLPKENINYVNGANPNLKAYIEKIKSLGGADIVMLGVGMDGHLAFNEPPLYSKFNSRMQEVSLVPSTIEANKEDYPEIVNNPYAYTQGMADIFEGKHLFFLANKAKKAQIVKQSLEGPITEDIPASILQKHPKVTVVLDREAASLLENDTLAGKPLLPQLFWLPVYSAEDRMLSTSNIKKYAASSATVSKLDQNVEFKVGQLLNDFSFPLEDIKKTISAFVSDAHKGLAGKPSSLKMLPTFVDNPTGKETGHFLALDLGGTNFRVLMIELKANGKKPIIRIKKFKLTDEHTKTSGDILFSAIAKFIKKFLQERKYLGSYNLGFTFSFPVRQTDIDKGILINWAKGFTAKGVVGKNIVRLLKEALRKEGIKTEKVKVVSLDNDTTGTQVARAYLDSECDMGVILGTGTNICARMPVAWITKQFNRRKYHADQMIVNFESGNFNKALPRTKYDEMLDVQSENPGKQWQEKMVSGKYLGEVGRLVLKDLAERGILFGSRIPWRLRKTGRFQTKTIGKIIALEPESNHAHFTQKVNELLLTKHDKDFKISREDAVMIHVVLNLISKRAARIAAAVIVGALKVIDPELSRNHTIAVDGTLFKKHPQFQENMLEVFKELVGNKTSRIKLELTGDGSGIGAAIIAAVASKQKSASSAADF